MINLAQIGNSQKEHVRWYKAKTCAIFVPDHLCSSQYPRTKYIVENIFSAKICFVFWLTFFISQKFLEILEEWFLDCILEI